MNRALELGGMTFGRLTVLRRNGSTRSQARWECRCACGALTSTTTAKLTSGSTKSCGCLKNERIRKLGLARAGTAKPKAKCSASDCDNVCRSSGVRYCGMHAARLARAGSLEISRRPNGTGNINAAGYVDVRINSRRTYEHIRVAEKALGKRLPKGAVVHHVNGIRSDNRTENLVICPSEAYHKLIHRRMRKLGYA